MNEKIKNEITDLFEEGRKILLDFSNDIEEKESGTLRRSYQIWYTKASVAVRELLPHRIEEFNSYYNCTNRKKITSDNYAMSDFLLGNSLTETDLFFNPKAISLLKFTTQLNIIESITENIDNVLFNLKNNIEFEVMDDELETARKMLKKGFFRCAGALCGVILEKHFKTVLTNHNLKLTKKDPNISDYNDLLKKENVYDTINWRFIQRLGDIRNLCDHSKHREPTKEEIEDLINGTEKVIKTIF